MSSIILSCRYYSFIQKKKISLNAKLC